MLTQDDSKVQIPKLNVSPKAQEDEKMDVQGNAMTLPTPKEASRSEERRRSMPVVLKEAPRPPPKPSSASSNSAVSHEACEKELKEVLVSE